MGPVKEPCLGKAVENLQTAVRSQFASFVTLSLGEACLAET